jgi:hypothetical protein
MLTANTETSKIKLLYVKGAMKMKQVTIEALHMMQKIVTNYKVHGHPQSDAIVLAEVNTIQDYIEKCISQPEPQFQNDDLVYDIYGNAYAFIGLDHKHRDAAVIYNPESENFETLPLSELSREKPIIPKEGEWWMCDINRNEMNVVLKFVDRKWYSLSSNHGVVAMNYNSITPLYRMVREESDHETNQ